MSTDATEINNKKYKFEEILQKYIDFYLKLYDDFNKEAQLADISVLSLKRQYEKINKKLENTYDYMNDVDLYYIELQRNLNELCKLEERLVSFEERIENMNKKTKEKVEK